MTGRTSLGILVALLLAGQAQAWRPDGWVWFSWPYANEIATADWYWLNTNDVQWVYGYPPASGWQRLEQSALSQGWSWWAWPYAYDSESAAWFYLNEADSLSVVSMGSSRWTRIGTASPTSGMLKIPAGTFQMGDQFGDNDTQEPSELPVHSVSVSAFYMDRFEITKSRWASVRAWALTNGYSDLPAGLAKGSNHPICDIDWFALVKWCNARSEKAGLVPAYYTTSSRTTVFRTGEVFMANNCVNWSAGYRLPTEAEWERAARGGAANARFPWTDFTNRISHAKANYGAGGYSYDLSSGPHPLFAGGAAPYTSPVGTFPPNAYGLHDMAGNVLEWCWDGVPDGGYPSTLQIDPHGPNSGLSNRARRGGSWMFSASACRVSWRDRSYIGASGGPHTGFRTVLSANAVPP